MVAKPRSRRPRAQPQVGRERWKAVLVAAVIVCAASLQILHQPTDVTVAVHTSVAAFTTAGVGRATDIVSPIDVASVSFGTSSAFPIELDRLEQTDGTLISGYGRYLIKPIGNEDGIARFSRGVTRLTTLNVDDAFECVLYTDGAARFVLHGRGHGHVRVDLAVENILNLTLEKSGVFSEDGRRVDPGDGASIRMFSTFSTVTFEPARYTPFYMIVERSQSRGLDTLQLLPAPLQASSLTFTRETSGRWVSGVTKLEVEPELVSASHINATPLYVVPRPADLFTVSNLAIADGQLGVRFTGTTTTLRVGASESAPNVVPSRLVTLVNSPLGGVLGWAKKLIL